MPGKAAKVTITERQKAILEQIVNSTVASRRLVQRAQIILLAFAGVLNATIGSAVGLDAGPVGKWRRRWQDSFDALVAIECNESRGELRRAIEDVWSDAPRPGAPGKFTAEQVTQVLAIACEPPEKSGRPVDAWSGRELADELVSRGIVASISTSQVNRFLHDAELQPHRSKYWLNTTEKDHERFEQQVLAVCNCYREAPALYTQCNTHTVCVDEMTGVQAIERNAQTRPMEPGRPARVEFEYTRHGTLCLTGNWHVVEGRLITPTIGKTRTEEDFVGHIQQTVASDPQASWVFVVDNLNTHCSEGLARYVASQEGIDASTLGTKGRKGILQSTASRQRFLGDLNHRIRFVYLPKHSSWLNQIEIVFGIVTRRVLRRGNFPSLQSLRERLLDFIDYFNRTFARPFRWTFTGRPITAATARRPATWKERWAKKPQARQTLALVTP